VKETSIKRLPIEQRSLGKLPASDPSSLSDLYLITLLIGLGTWRKLATLLDIQIEVVYSHLHRYTESAKGNWRESLCNIHSSKVY
jgi:hypothetical protein